MFTLVVLHTCGCSQSNPAASPLAKHKLPRTPLLLDVCSGPHYPTNNIPISSPPSSEPVWPVLLPRGPGADPHGVCGPGALRGGWPRDHAAVTPLRDSQR